MKCIQCLATPLGFSKGNTISDCKFYSPVTQLSCEMCRNHRKQFDKGGMSLTSASPAPGNNTVSYCGRHRQSCEREINPPRTLPCSLTEAMLNHRPAFYLIIPLGKRNYYCEEFCSVLRGFTIPGQPEMVKEPRSVKLTE